jgi:hypothetical protein
VFHRPHNCPNLRRGGIMVIQQKRSEVGYSHSKHGTISSGNMEGECGSVQSSKLLGEGSHSLSSLRSCSGPNCSKGYHGQQALNSERNANIIFVNLHISWWLLTSCSAMSLNPRLRRTDTQSLPVNVFKNLKSPSQRTRYAPHLLQCL